MSLDIIVQLARKMNDKQRATSRFIMLKQGKQSRHGPMIHTSSARLTTMYALVFLGFLSFGPSKTE
jgi:hypothetical protein